MQSVRDVLLVVFAAVIIVFPNLGRPRLWDRDEPRNAGCAREMMERADWVVPVFNDELRTHKPVLLYWFMMATYALFGVTEFAARFSSASFSVGTAVLTYFIARRMFSRSIGLWSAMILTTFVMFGVVSRAATPDATLIFFCTAAMAIFVQGVWPDDASSNLSQSTSQAAFPRSWVLAAAMYSTMGIAVLAKGPVGLVLPTAVIGMFGLIWRADNRHDVNATSWLRIVQVAGQWFHPVHFLKTCWSMRPITAVLSVLIVAGPWYAWVGWRTDGAWLAGFLGEHNLGRALSPMEGHLRPDLAVLSDCDLGVLLSVVRVYDPHSEQRCTRRKFVKSKHPSAFRLHPADLLGPRLRGRLFDRTDQVAELYCSDFSRCRNPAGELCRRLDRVSGGV